MAGVLLYFLLGSEPPVWWGMTGVLGGVAVAAAGWRVFAVRAVGLALVVAAAGFLAGSVAAWRAAPGDTLPTRAAVLAGVVRGVDTLEDGRRLVIEGGRIGDQALRRVVRVRMKAGDETAVAAGDQIEVRALLRPPSGPAYPGGWDQQRDAWFNGVGGGGTALGVVRVVSHAAPAGPGAWLQAVRDGVGARAMAALPGPTGAVAATLLTGSTRAIPEADRAAFRDSGLAHLLAVAGLHIGIVMGLFMLVTRLGIAAWPYAALHWPGKAVAAWAALAGGAGYLLLTGAHVPILRSFAMAALVTLGVAVGRRALSLRGLALAAGGIALFAPQEVVGVSFQMSFAAVLALIAGYDALRPVLSRLHGGGWRRVALHGAGPVVTSLLAGTASAPYAAYHFGHVQLYFIVANVVAVPLTALWVLPWGVVALLLMPFGAEQMAFTPMGWGLEAILWVARDVSSWPAATVSVPPMPAWGLAVFSLGLAWLCLWRTPVRLAGVAVMVLGLLSPLMAPAPDVLVSSDGKLVAWRGPGGWALAARPGASWFVRDAWRTHLAVDAWRPLADGCDEAACRAGGALLVRGKARGMDCEGVQIVISGEPARGVCPGAALVDRFTVWRDGAAAVWLGGAAPMVLTDRAVRGERPWVPAPPVPGRRATNLPMAPSMPLPAIVPETDEKED